MEPFARTIDAAKNYVVSSTLDRVDWNADISSFVRHALAYMTAQPIDDITGRTPALVAELIGRLSTEPWLFVLDGFDQLLGAYARSDLIEDRADMIEDPAGTIEPASREMLRAMTAPQRSKILITSRMVPSAVLNASHNPIPGVAINELGGLTDADAEAILRVAGVHGDSDAMRGFLSENAGNHPLVTGLIAGLVNGYVPDRGNFNVWASDSFAGGAPIIFATANLLQKRTHILSETIRGLRDESRKLLVSLAAAKGPTDYATVASMFTTQHSGSEADTRSSGRRSSRESQKLGEAIRDLEVRGLLHYDRATRCYDVHPVVRALAFQIDQQET